MNFQERNLRYLRGNKDEDTVIDFLNKKYPNKNFKAANRIGVEKFGPDISFNKDEKIFTLELKTIYSKVSFCNPKSPDFRISFSALTNKSTGLSKSWSCNYIKSSNFKGLLIFYSITGDLYFLSKKYFKKAVKLFDEKQFRTPQEKHNDPVWVENRIPKNNTSINNNYKLFFCFRPEIAIYLGNLNHA